MAVNGAHLNPAIKFINALVFNGLESFGKYYSKYRAWVADNDDPENLSRLKLVIPQISGNQAYNYWAFPTGVYSGENYGSQVIPKKGDTVWVEFEGGRPEIPIWSHGHRSRKEMPKDRDEDWWKDKESYWIRTPKGNWIMLNDTKNFVHIENTTKNYTELNEKGISLVTKKAISLGTLNKSEYKAVLGEPNREVLEDIDYILKTLHEAWMKDMAIWTARGFTNTVTALPKVLDKVQGLSGKIKKILSNLVTLDK